MSTDSMVNLRCFILIVLVKVSVENNLKVTRRIDKKGNEVWWAARDKFTLSQSVCNKINGLNKCAKLGASNPDFRYRCSCRCPWDKPTIWNKCGKWRCVDDPTIRNQEECGIIFNKVENLKSRLTFLNTFAMVKFHIPKPNNKLCAINETASRYLSCSGEWLPIKEKQLNTRRFMLLRHPQEDTPIAAQYELLVNATVGSPNITGRLIKLAFTCKLAIKKPCLLFKIIGSYTCQEKQPISKTCQTNSTTVVPTPSISMVAMETKAVNATAFRPSINFSLGLQTASPSPTIASKFLPVSTADVQVSNALSNEGGTTETNSLKSEMQNNMIIAIACGAAGFAVAVVLVTAVVATTLHRRKSRNITTITKTTKRGKRKNHLSDVTRKNEAANSNQAKTHPGSSPHINNDDGIQNDHKVLNNGLILELKSRLRNSVKALNLSSWRNRSNTDSSTRELETSSNAHSNETVDHDDDSDDYVDEDWGSFSESDGNENENSGTSKFENKTDINIYDTPEGIAQKGQTERYSRGSRKGGHYKKSGVNVKRKSAAVSKGSGNHGFQGEADNECDDENIYEVLKETNFKKN